MTVEDKCASTEDLAAFVIPDMEAKPNEVKTVDLGAVANGWPFASNQFVGTVQYTESTSVTIVNMCGSMVVSFRD